MIGPVDPTKRDISQKAPSKEALPNPSEFRLPERVPKAAPQITTTYPAFEALDHAQRLMNSPVQATLEVLNQGALPEGKQALRVLKEQTGIFLARAIAKEKI